MRINDHFLKLKAGYLFPEIARRTRGFVQANPQADIIKLGIGDVTEPLPPAVIEAMHKAVDDMSRRDTFRGYADEGYDFLRDKIAEHDYQARHCDIDPSEIFVSDGSKCDSANILDILGRENRLAVMDPVYPVYVDTNVMAGFTGEADADGKYEGLVYLPITAENGFMAELPTEKIDVVYLCYPNNPTGTVASRETLAKWVDYALRNESLILFDAAYEAYITDPQVPHSIYEIDGARDVAIEFRSFSKNAGFTGTRCAFTVVPKTLKGRARDGRLVDLHGLWFRRQSTKFNQVAYVVQRGAEAVYSDEGAAQIGRLVAFYLENAQIIRQTLESLGLQVYGGKNAPYVWLKTPGNMPSWEFFDKLLAEAHVVGTPGSGFGTAGEGYFRISAFNSRDKVEQAMDRIRQRVK